MKYIKKFNESGDFDSVSPIGIDNLSTQATYGVELIFSPLESDMVSEWNSDKKIMKWVAEKRLFLSELSYDQWGIYGIEGDEVVKNYIIENYAW